MPGLPDAAVEAIARHFSAYPEPGDDPSWRALTVAGRRIALQVASLGGRFAGPADGAHHRLRRDRVVQRLDGALRAALGPAVPDGMAMLLTVTAPIRLPSRTALALEDMARCCLADRSGPAERQEVVHGNHVRLRLVAGGARPRQGLVVIVHHPETNPLLLLDLAEALLRHIGDAAARQAPAADARWLALVFEDGAVPLAMLRQLHAQLALDGDFARIVLVNAGGQVATLAD